MYNWHKGIVSCTIGKILYQSIPFTWLLPLARKEAKEYKKGKVVAGGPAVILAKHDDFFDMSWAETPDEIPFDILSFHNPLATFTTRGCPNACKFCAVPKLEGDFVEFESWKPAPVVCDNNLLAGTMKHFSAVIDSLKRFPFVDFNQGLEARRLKPEHVDLLRSLKSVKIRFAFDHSSSETVVHDAIELCRKSGLKNFGVYCLIGFNDTPDDAKQRLEIVCSWKIMPNPMRYQPLDALEKNHFIDKNWTEKELLKMMHYYSRLVYMGNVCTYEDLDYLKHYSGGLPFEELDS
jgi:MoaA/NifB/PqqE/SkfB family radical SAM enzyme